MSAEYLRNIARQLEDQARRIRMHADTLDPIEETSEVVAEVTNKDGLPISPGENVGLLGGITKDGQETLIDEAMPQFTETANGPWDNWESTDYHERVEFANRHRGYDIAHNVATEAEHARMRQMGFDPNEIEEKNKKYIDTAKHRAKFEGAVAREDTSPYPYIDGGDEKLLNRKIADERCIFDKDGERYINPEPLLLLGLFDCVSCCCDSDKLYAVIELNSASILGEGSTRNRAISNARENAERMGAKRLESELLLMPPRSQQQLMEIHHNGS